MYAFANTINTVDGGTHLTGLRMALTRTINELGRKQGVLKDSDPNFSGDDTREGLTAIISIKHRDPQFESQTKVKLMNAEVQTQVQQVVGEALGEFLEQNPRALRAIVQKCLTSARARDAAKKARDLVIRKSALESLTLPGKLADCSEREPNKCELYIVEGDSAGGSAKQGRDRHFQAILPLRGKILNTERARLDKILSNNEVKALISALGTGIGDGFDLSGLRYGRVIIMTDADVDGSHIRTLLLTFFFRYMPALIEEGHLFIAQPPLFRIALKNKVQYAYSEGEREKVSEGNGRRRREGHPEPLQGSGGDEPRSIVGHHHGSGAAHAVAGLDRRRRRCRPHVRHVDGGGCASPPAVHSDPRPRSPQPRHLASRPPAPRAERAPGKEPSVLSPFEAGPRPARGTLDIDPGCRASLAASPGGPLRPPDPRPARHPPPSTRSTLRTWNRPPTTGS